MAKKIRHEQIEGNILSSLLGSIIDNTDPKNPKIDEEALANLPFHGLSQNTKTSEMFSGDINTLPNGNYSVALHSSATNAPAFIGTPRSIIVFGNASGVPATVGKIILGTEGVGYKIGTSDWIQLTTGEKAKEVTNIAFSGTTEKTLTITFSDGSTTSAQFTDLNTTYSALTAALLNAGTSTTAGVIAPKVLVDYINSRLASVLNYKGSKDNYSELPTSGNKVGDVWNIRNADPANGVKAGDNVAWTGTEWDVLSGFIDTSIFLTEETDPKGVASLEITGTSTKTVKIKLRDGTEVTGTFTDLNTTYQTGTPAQLSAGTDTTGKLWSAKTLYDFITSLGITISTEVFTISESNIESNLVRCVLSGTPDLIDSGQYAVFMNGVKLPYGACAIEIYGPPNPKAGVNLEIKQLDIPTPIIVGDEIEIFYKSV